MTGLGDTKFTLQFKGTTTDSKSTTKSIVGVNFTNSDTLPADTPSPETILQFAQNLNSLTTNEWVEGNINGSRLLTGSN